MRPSSYLESVADRNVVMRRIAVYAIRCNGGQHAVSG